MHNKPKLLWQHQNVAQVQVIMTQTQLLRRSALLAPWQTQDFLSLSGDPKVTVKSFSTSSWEQLTYDYDTYVFLFLSI